MSTVRIRFTRTGGFANVRLRADVDDPAEVARILGALQQLRLGFGDDPTRDGFIYEFAVEHSTAAAPPPVAVQERDLPDDLRAITRDLVARARPS